MSNIILKIRKKPFVFIKNFLYKTTIGPLKYGKKNNYNANKYWHDRFGRHGLSFASVGDEGLSENENKRRYEINAALLLNILQDKKINFQDTRVLDIGCGIGYYTNCFHNLGIKNYMGIDVTNIFFANLSKIFFNYKFIKKDITKDKITGKYDIIIMINVIEHIVNKSKFLFAIKNIKQCISDKGLLIITPVRKQSKKHLFYVKFWGLENISNQFLEFNKQLLSSGNNQWIIITK